MCAQQARPATGVLGGRYGDADAPGRRWMQATGHATASGRASCLRRSAGLGDASGPVTHASHVVLFVASTGIVTRGRSLVQARSPGSARETRAIVALAAPVRFSQPAAIGIRIFS